MNADAAPYASLNNSRSIGAILIDNGCLDPQQAEQVIRLQDQQPGLRFGDAAIQLGLVTDQDIQKALSSQFVYPYLSAKDSHISREVVAAYEPFSGFVEQLRVLRSQLLLRWFDGSDERKALAIVGADSGEGRSFLAANLAVVFSQLGERTLLLDADLRNPRQHQLFKLSNRAGFSSVLAGRANLSEAIFRIPGLLGLSVMGSGAVPPNPQELLCRPTYARLMAELQNQFDIIIVDTPAGSEYSDAQAISSVVKGAVVVSNKDQTEAGRLQELAQRMRESGTNLVGSLLNKV